MLKFLYFIEDLTINGNTYFLVGRKFLFFPCSYLYHGYRVEYPSKWEWSRLDLRYIGQWSWRSKTDAEDALKKKRKNQCPDISRIRTYIP